MKVYLAGAIKGTEDYYQRFAKAASKLRMQGHSVYNPAAANLEGMSLARIMAHLLPQLCECEAIALLPDWKESGGAKVERDLADYIGLQIIELV